VPTYTTYYVEEHAFSSLAETRSQRQYATPSTRAYLQKNGQAELALVFVLRPKVKYANGPISVLTLCDLR